MGGDVGIQHVSRRGLHRSSRCRRRRLATAQWPWPVPRPTIGPRDVGARDTRDKRARTRPVEAEGPGGGDDGESETRIGSDDDSRAVGVQTDTFPALESGRPNIDGDTGRRSRPGGGGQRTGPRGGCRCRTSEAVGGIQPLGCIPTVPPSASSARRRVSAVPGHQARQGGRG